ncbi:MULTISPECIES: universal stress protein [Streptomyces]|uniref:Universal stress protein n=1 Tax=Streptomyces edwardsiae TaxID=3075527 RepID=A0ABU2QM70_9ACTN|nr:MULTISPECIES: universal stress protein [unclassified Streptomyces]MDT0405106.1 universal stress protein [Streptomyces sp. DSM 41635]
MADRARGRGLHRGRVDGSDASKEALRHARLTGGEVRALTAWDFPQFHGARGWLPPSSSDETALKARAQEDVDEVVQQTVGTRPPVIVRAEVHYGTPASVLLRAAHEATLLVIGSRGLGGFAGPLPGSVAQHRAQHADCPVVIVRERRCPRGS